MIKTPCPYCADRADENTRTCKHCGGYLPNTAIKPSQANSRIELMTTFMVLAVIAFCVAVFAI